MNTKTLVVIVCSVLCLAAGAAASAVVVAQYDHYLYEEKNKTDTHVDGIPIEGRGDGKGKGGGGFAKKPGGGGGFNKKPGGGFNKKPGGGGGFNKKKGGFGGPSSQTELATLVEKLDRLTGAPLKLKLTRKQKDQLAEQLEGLEEPKELTEAEAQKRLDRIMAILADNRDVLKAAGVRLPGDMSMPAAGPNPFVTAEKGERLQELLKTLKAK